MAMLPLKRFSETFFSTWDILEPSPGMGERMASKMDAPWGGDLGGSIAERDKTQFGPKSTQCPLTPISAAIRSPIPGEG